MAVRKYERLSFHQDIQLPIDISFLREFSFSTEMLFDGSEVLFQVSFKTIEQRNWMERKFMEAIQYTGIEGDISDIDGFPSAIRLKFPADVAFKF